MNWKLVFQLSVFGLIMAFATVSLIPIDMEPLFWLLIFIFCAWVIAKAAPGRFFLHGFATCLVNCVWVTLFHSLSLKTYLLHHPGVAKMYSAMPAPLSYNPKLAVIATGPVFGILSGMVLALFSFIASKFIKNEYFSRLD